MRIRNGLLSLLLLLALALVAYRPMQNYEAATAPLYQGLITPGRDAPPPTLKIITWNIQYAEDVPTALAELQTTPELQEADVLLLQEMDERGTAAIATALGMNYVYYPASVHSHHGRNFGNAVLARWPITASEKLLLPYQNPKNGQQRIAVRAVLAIGQTPLVVYSVHTETIWLSAPRRQAQVAALLQRVAAEPGPVIVGGDFNTLTASSVVRLTGQFAALGLYAAPAGASSSFAGLTFTLDHLFLRSLTPSAAGTWSGTNASDHAPVWVTMPWPPPTTATPRPVAFLPTIGLPQQKTSPATSVTGEVRSYSRPGPAAQGALTNNLGVASKTGQ